MGIRKWRKSRTKKKKLGIRGQAVFLDSCIAARVTRRKMRTLDEKRKPMMLIVVPKLLLLVLVLEVLEPTLPMNTIDMRKRIKVPHLNGEKQLDMLRSAQYRTRKLTVVPELLLLVLLERLNMVCMNIASTMGQERIHYSNSLQ